MSAFTGYVDCLDQLRRAREACGDDLAMLDNLEIPILDKMDVLWEQMTFEEKVDARKLAWRSWPEQYKAQMNEMPTKLVDQVVWGTNNPPRKKA